jgi:diguanylate cyclase (GGDEF)-like protein
VHAALEHALWITTATSEEELTTRAVEAAGKLTGATVACAVDAAGGGHTWGETTLAAAVLAEACGAPRASTPVNAFAHLGLPAALAATDAGTLLVVAASEADRFGPDAAHLLSLVVAHAAAGRDRLREVAMLSQLAERDPLTGLRHYRPFEERLAASVPEQTAVIAVDIDNFKQINDVYGHQAGDEALVALVRALRRALRGDDHIYRIGGDEFAVVVDVASTDEITGITHRLLLAARAVGYPISVGAALRAPTETGRETLLRADRALYQAKRDGRNTAHLAA